MPRALRASCRRDGLAFGGCWRPRRRPSRWTAQRGPDQRLGRQRIQAEKNQLQSCAARTFRCGPRAGPPQSLMVITQPPAESPGNVIGIEMGGKTHRVGCAATRVSLVGLCQAYPSLMLSAPCSSLFHPARDHPSGRVGMGRHQRGGNEATIVSLAHYNRMRDEVRDGSLPLTNDRILACSAEPVLGFGEGWPNHFPRSPLVGARRCSSQCIAVPTPAQRRAA